MSAEVFYCPAETYAQTRDNPAEYCEEEVPEEGDLCSKHDADDRRDADYESYLEMRRDELVMDR